MVKVRIRVRARKKVEFQHEGESAGARLGEVSLPLVQGIGAG